MVFEFMVVRWLLNSILPQRCIGCRRFIAHTSNNSLCADCWSKLEFIVKPICDRCGKSLGNTIDHLLHAESQTLDLDNLYASYLCNEQNNARHSLSHVNQQKCYNTSTTTNTTAQNYSINIVNNLCVICKFQRRKIYYHRIRAALQYNNNLAQNLIREFKYHDNTKLQHIFVKWLLLYGEDFMHESDLVIPVPLHKKRLLIRHYNQSAVIAKVLAKHMHKTFLPNAIIRIKDVVSQSKMNMEKRWQNVEGIFAINNKSLQSIQGSRVLLVDDVVTTSATVNECAKVLREKGGASTVNILSIART